MYKVSGRVTWKGAPIESGRINLISADGTSAPASARIENGKFELQSTSGPKRVEVFNQRDRGFDRVINQRAVANDIPGEYNGQTRPRFDARPGDDNVLELDLPQK